MLNRSTLVNEASKAIRQAIADGRYGSSLPAERRLAADLGVSRPTVRAALAVLEREKLVSVSARRRRTIFAGARRPAEPGTLTIRLLHDNGPASHLSEHLLLLEYLAENLPQPKYAFHLEPSPACFATHPEHALEARVTTRQADLWILYRSTQAMQEWFERRGLPAILLGSKFPGISLPAADEDFHAVCRHAAGLLLARGHRRIVILLPDLLRAGDAASRDGFLEAFERSKGPNPATPIVCEHDSTTAGICRVTARIAAMQPRPTAVLVSNARPFLTVHTHLMRLGLGIPRDISLVCRNSDPAFGAIVPAPAHYARNTDLTHRKLLKLILNRLHGGKTRDVLFASDFVDGESLGRVK